MRPEEIAEIIEDYLSRGRQIYQGQILGATNAGSRVSVELLEPVPGVGRVITVIAGNDCLGGSAIVFRADNGTWYAFSGENQQETISTQLVITRQRRAIAPAPNVYPFKVLFSIVENGMRKFYVGGDRTSPTQIFTVEATAEVLEAWISNTGSRTNDWIAGIKLSDNN